MPAGSSAGTAVTLHVILLFSGGDGGSLPRVETHRDYVEFLAHIEFHHLHGAGEARENLSAEHGAVVVDKVQDQWLFAEVVAEFDGAAGVVDESEIGRDLPVKVLLDADILQVWWPDIRWRRHDAFRHRL